MAEFKIDLHLKSLTNTYKHFMIFENTAEYGIIAQSIESVLRTALAVEGFNLTIKVILGALVDSIWMNLSRMEGSQGAGKADFGKLSKAKSQSIQRSVSRPETSFFTSQSKEALSINKPEELKFMSEFSHSKGPTFPKQKRVLGDNRERIPGPSDYHQNPDLLLRSNPKITIPKSPRNINFVNSTTPGPSAYNPSKHFSTR